MDALEKRPYVLIAEDDPDDRELLKEAFADRCRDCDLQFVQNGEELLDFLATRAQKGTVATGYVFPHLLLLDLNMPLKDGREALLALKADEQYAAIDIVILSTSESPEDRVFCMKHGAREYLIKPPGYTQLLELVARLSVYLRPENHEPYKPEHHE